jgi:hypothetical protein
MAGWVQECAGPGDVDYCPHGETTSERAVVWRCVDCLEAWEVQQTAGRRFSDDEKTAA